MNLITKLIATLMLLVTFSAHSAIISIDSSFGIDSVTKDDVSNLEWLDLTYTTHLSYNNVLTQFGVGGQFEGWHFATVSEFEALWFGITGIDNNPVGSSESYPDGTIDDAILMFGDTYQTWLDAFSYGDSDAGCISASGDANCGRHENRGYLLTANQTFVIDAIAHDISEASLRNDYSSALNTTQSRDAQWYDVGSWLVRESATVPEPTTILLWGAGFFVFSVSRRRKLNKQ